jgi:hypothetical protein
MRYDPNVEFDQGVEFLCLYDIKTKTSNVFAGWREGKQ